MLSKQLSLGQLQHSTKLNLIHLKLRFQLSQIKAAVFHPMKLNKPNLYRRLISSRKLGLNWLLKLRVKSRVKWNPSFATRLRKSWRQISQWTWLKRLTWLWSSKRSLWKTNSVLKSQRIFLKRKKKNYMNRSKRWNHYLIKMSRTRLTKWKTRIS